MYKNPLNNGDISDYNSLKKQRNPSQIINKYKKKLPTEPTELQKYYQYMTYQKPILDEANYVAERMRTEDINKEKSDFNFIEDLKIKREEEMKKKSQ
jgi:DNA/RNA endonuclease G (NUC1)